jgi:hypothetical protein
MAPAQAGALFYIDNQVDGNGTGWFKVGTESWTFSTSPPTIQSQRQHIKWQFHVLHRHSDSEGSST